MTLVAKRCWAFEPFYRLIAFPWHFIVLEDLGDAISRDGVK